jgi:hypothetical protein
MQSALKNLTTDEISELHLIPVWVSILVAGADNKIDKTEFKKSIQIANKKQNTANSLILDYYKTVAAKFEVNLKGYIALMPNDKEQRVEFLLKKLERVNYIFSKLEKDFSYQLYLSFRDFANEVAHASGGFFGLLSVSFAESKFIDLKMIHDPSKLST